MPRVMRKQQSMVKCPGASNRGMLLNLNGRRNLVNGAAVREGLPIGACAPLAAQDKKRPGE